MSKIRAFGVAFMATAGIVLAGTGIAAAAPDTGTTPPPATTNPGTGDGGTVGTGSAQAAVDIVKLLVTGSADKGTTPTPKP